VLKDGGGIKRNFITRAIKERSYSPEEEESLEELLAGMEWSIDLLGDKMQKDAEQKRWLMVNLHECINRLTDEAEPFERTWSAFLHPLKGFITRRRGRMVRPPVSDEIITVPDAELEASQSTKPSERPDEEPNIVPEKSVEITSLEQKVRRLICRLNLLTMSIATRSYRTDGSIEHLKGRLALIDPNQL
jgi:hypothetical protein